MNIVNDTISYLKTNKYYTISVLAIIYVLYLFYKIGEVARNAEELREGYENEKLQLGKYRRSN